MCLLFRNLFRGLNVPPFSLSVLLFKDTQAFVFPLYKFMHQGAV